MCHKVFLLSLLFSMLQLAAGITLPVPAPDQWKLLGEGTRIETGADRWRVIPDQSNDPGVWSGHAFTLNKAKYRLAFRYRLDKGELHVVVKHGDNTYSLFDKRLPATGEAGKRFEIEMEETVPGPHGSLWFHAGEPFELADLRFERIPRDEEQKLADALKLQRVTQRKAGDPGTLPDLRNTFLMIQEWHMWFASDVSPQGSEAWWHVWGQNRGRNDYLRSVGPLWRRAFDDLSIPYVGPYSAANPEVVRWQIRCMKNAGFDGTLCQMYPNPENGRRFENLELFEQFLQIAEKEGYRLGVHDEIQFMTAPAKDVNAFVERASQVLELQKKYPETVLRFKGMPVYQYEGWNMPWSPAQHQEMMNGVEKKIGEKVFWIVSGPPEKMNQVEGLGALKNPANSWVHTRREGTTRFGDGTGSMWDPKTMTPDRELFYSKFDQEIADVSSGIAAANRIRKNPLRQAIWVYPSFNNARSLDAPVVLPERSFDRAEYFVEILRRVLKNEPELLNLAAWNEQQEKTAFEPSWNNSSEDPFELLRLVAAMRGIEFKEPPLPPKEYVDPMLWSVLYGVDRTPPRIIGIRAHTSEANLAVDLLDDLSGPERVQINAAPMLLARFDCGDPLLFQTETSVSKHEKIPAGLKVVNDGSLSLELTAPDKPLHAPWLAIKYRAPEKSILRFTLDYPRAPAYDVYRLNGSRNTTVPPGPFLPGTGRSRWATTQLHNLKLKAGETGKLSLSARLTPAAGVDPATLDPAVIEAVALFPAQPENETGRGFVLPGPGKEFRTFVVGFPDKLLPRNFFGIPIAAQGFDSEGNASPLQVFELNPEVATQSPSAYTIELCDWIWR